MTQISLRKSVPGCHAMTWVRSPRRGWIQVSWHLLAFVTPKTKGFGWQNSWMRMILLRVAISNCWSTIDPLWGHYEHWALIQQKCGCLTLRHTSVAQRSWGSGGPGAGGSTLGVDAKGGMVGGDPWYPICRCWITIRYCLVVSFFAKLRTIAEHSWAINCTSGTMFPLTSLTS